PSDSWPELDQIDWIPSKNPRYRAKLVATGVSSRSCAALMLRLTTRSCAAPRTAAIARILTHCVTPRNRSTETRLPLDIFIASAGDASGPEGSRLVDLPGRRRDANSRPAALGKGASCQGPRRCQADR